MSLITKFSSPVLGHKKRCKAVAAIEFALTLPIFLLLLLGTMDVAYLLLVSQRVDRVAYSVTDIITQSEAITQEDLSNILSAASELMNPFSFDSNGVVIVSSIYKEPGQATKIVWQYTGGGTLARPSKLGNDGDIPDLPNSLTLNDNDNIIIAEVYYVFTPMFINAGILAKQDLYRIAVYKPRLSPLVSDPS